MTPQTYRWGALAACAGALALAWLLTDVLAGWVILPLLASLTAAGLMIAREARAPIVATLAGGLQAVHAALLIAAGHGPRGLESGYLVCALLLAGCGLALYRHPLPPAPADPGPDLDDRPL